VYKVPRFCNLKTWLQLPRVVGRGGWHNAGVELSCIATCSKGLEAILAGELEALGLAPRVGEGVVRFAGSWAQVARANLWLRTAVRVLVELAAGPCQGREELYQLAAAVPWEDLVTESATLAVRVAGGSSAFVNTHFAALVVKDAVVDRLRARRGFRPRVDLEDPHLPLVLHLGEASATLSLDTSGEPLTHRGYRPRQALAPLAEHLAAGLLLLSGYDGSVPLLDPMCGSGTLLVEAALLAGSRAPGAKRRFAFERWGFVNPAWLREAREEAAHRARRPEQPIEGFDLDPNAVAQARRAASRAGVGGEVRVVRGDARKLPALAPGTLVVSNPPYGMRVGEERALRELYRAFGHELKAKAKGCTAWLLLGNPSLAKEVGLAPVRKFVVYNGPVRCQFCCYPVVEGTFRKRRVPGE